jgi:hypothetical protein
MGLVVARKGNWGFGSDLMRNIGTRGEPL